MTTDYRSLCAELIDALDSGIPAKRIRLSPLANRARAALAEQPELVRPTKAEIHLLADNILDGDRASRVDFARAVLARWGNPAPQPPAEGEGPSDAELLKTYCDARRAFYFEVAEGKSDQEDRKDATVAGLRAILARWGNHPAKPDGSPADGEVGELVEWLRDRAESTSLAHTALRITRAADLLQRLSPPQPVPVSERLPRPADCDVEGRCWMLGKVERDWRLINPEKSGLPHLRYCFSHWLPFHALPLPELEVNK